jgi:hypothetical protein
MLLLLAAPVSENESAAVFLLCYMRIGKIRYLISQGANELQMVSRVRRN